MEQSERFLFFEPLTCNINKTITFASSLIFILYWKKLIETGTYKLILAGIHDRSVGKARRQRGIFRERIWSRSCCVGHGFLRLADSSFLFLGSSRWSVQVVASLHGGIHCGQWYNLLLCIQGCFHFTGFSSIATGEILNRYHLKIRILFLLLPYYRNLVLIFNWLFYLSKLFYFIFLIELICQCNFLLFFNHLELLFYEFF